MINRSITTGAQGNTAWTFMWAMTAELLIIVMFCGLFMVRESETIDPAIHVQVQHELKNAQDENGKWITNLMDARSDNGTLLLRVHALVAQLTQREKEANEVDGRWQIERKKLESVHGQLKADMADIKSRLAIASMEKARLEDQLSSTRLMVEHVRKVHESELASRDIRESGLRRDLIGLKGDFSRVVFVIDRSGSMAAAVRGVSRWHHTVEVVEQWLRFLPVEQAAIVSFSDDVTTSGAMATINQPKDRDILLGFLVGLRPEGYTDTASALKAAYDYKPTTIVLFTDGAPHLPGQKPDFMRRQAIDFVKTRAAAGQKPTINAIALGDYFNSPEMSQVLMDLTEQTGGAFIGR